MNPVTRGLAVVKRVEVSTEILFSKYFAVFGMEYMMALQCDDVEEVSWYPNNIHSA